MTITRRVVQGTAGPSVTQDRTNDPEQIPPARTMVGNVQGSALAAKPGYSSDTAALVKRLRRIEGQVRGLERMVETDAYCIDILTQVAAATRALEAVALQLLEGHLRHCVADVSTSQQSGLDDKITEASEAIRRLVRS